jgi:hypothetical protein
MTRRLRLRLFQHPASNQLWFRWVTVWLPLDPPRPPPLPAFWWRRARKAAERPPERSADRDSRTIDRFIRRGACCVLCGERWAPCDRRIGNRLILLCRSCDAMPNAMARIREIVSIEWAGCGQSDRDAHETNGYTRA